MYPLTPNHFVLCFQFYGFATGQPIMGQFSKMTSECHLKERNFNNKKKNPSEISQKGQINVLDYFKVNFWARVKVQDE